MADRHALQGGLTKLHRRRTECAVLDALVAARPACVGTPEPPAVAQSRGGFAAAAAFLQRAVALPRDPERGTDRAIAAKIGARLFLSPRTVEWHLRKVFAKLDIVTRQELADALPRTPSELMAV